MQAYIVRQINEGGELENSSVIASFSHRSDAVRLSEGLKSTYPRLDFPWFAVEVDVELWHALYEVLRNAEPLDNGGR